MKLLPAIIIAIALLLVPILWFALPRVFGAEGAAGQPQGMAIDSGARIDIEMLTQQVEDLRAVVVELQADLQELAMAPPPAPMPVPVSPTFDAGGAGGAMADPAGLGTGADAVQPLVQDGENAIIDAYAQVVQIVDRLKVNDTLTIAGPNYLAETFGLPRENLTNDCMPMTNPRLKSKLVTADVGPIKVQMLQPAIDSLRTVFENVRLTDPDLYARINTAGSLCVRLIRGSTNRASTHSYGLAVDLNIDGKLDTLGDGRTQLGLTILADFFKAEGWVWGAAWQREDSMHFEVSKQQLAEWVASATL